jgi:hypothetical protein
LNRKTKETLNLSNIIRSNPNYNQKYTDQKYEDLYLVLRSGNTTWSGDNPVFQVSDGWQILDGKWVYDLNTHEFKPLN